MWLVERVICDRRAANGRRVQTPVQTSQTVYQPGQIEGSEAKDEHECLIH